jgi:hypothetical protein
VTGRALGGLLLAISALLALSGCAVVGTVDVRSPDQVAIDLTVTGNESYLPLCEPTGWPADAQLAFEEHLNEVGDKTCHVTGVTHPEIIREYLALTHVGEYFAIEANPLSLAPRSPVPIGSVWSDPDTRLDVAISFPGRVLSTTGTADGATARFTDAQQFVRPYGLRVVALDHPGPEWTVLGPIVGLLAGVGLAVAWWYVRRQRRRVDPTGSGRPASSLRGQQRGHGEPEDAASPAAAEPDPASAAPTSSIVGGSGSGANAGGSGSEPNRPSQHSAERPTGSDDGRWAPPSG